MPLTHTVMGGPCLGEDRYQVLTEQSPADRAEAP